MDIFYIVVIIIALLLLFSIAGSLAALAGDEDEDFEAEDDTKY